MHRCFLSGNRYSVNDIIKIDGDEFFHISRVIRLKKNDIFEVFNDEGNVYVCKIVNFEKRFLEAEVVNTYKDSSEPEIKVFVFHCLSKGTKMDFVIQKATELGAYAVVPVESEFSVVKIDNYVSKLERWNKIAIEACKQCKRTLPTRIYEPLSFYDACGLMLENDVKLLAYESEKEVKLKDILDKTDVKNIKSVSMMIGPEGGFSDREIDFAKSKGIDIVSLGKRILRTETASVSMLSIIMYEID